MAHLALESAFKPYLFPKQKRAGVSQGRCLMDAMDTFHKPESKHWHRERRPAAQNTVCNCSHADSKKFGTYDEEKGIISPLKDLSELGSCDDNG